MPSVLIETGFLSNKNEGKYLNSQKGKEQMAKSIAKAILDYKIGVEGSFETKKKKKLPTTIPEIQSTEKKESVVTRVIVSEKEAPKPTPKPIIKPKVKTAVVVEKQKSIKATSTPKITQPSIKFRVQLAASRKFIEPSAQNFKGIPTIEMLEIEEYYKYYYGNTFDYSNAKELRREAIKYGFKTCFIVGFENGKPIKLFDAIKKSSEQ